MNDLRITLVQGATRWHDPAANREYYGHLIAPLHDRTDLVLLNIDPAALTDPVRWEPGVPTDPESMLFPHLYGPLPAAAVRSVTQYLPDSAGRFAEWSAR